MTDAEILEKPSECLKLVMSKELDPAVVSLQVSKSLDLPDGVRFLAGHGDADEDHTREIIEQIEAHIHGDDLADVHHVADVVADLYVRMFEQIGAGE